jgi:hypothetical protein
MGFGAIGFLCAIAHELKTNTASRRPVVFIEQPPRTRMIGCIVLGNGRYY